MTRTLSAISIAFALLILSSCGESEPREAAPEFVLGFDVTELSPDVRPQDDFWGYVNGRWLAATEIPADRSSHGTFRQLFDETEERIRTVVEAAHDATGAGEADASQQLVGDLYASFMDEQALEAAGTTALDDLFAQISSLKQVDELVSFFGEMNALGVTVPTDQYMDNDASDGTRLLLYLYQGGLGLPNRDYYLEDNEQFVKAKVAYEAHIAKLYELAGLSGGTEAAASIVALETQIAERQWAQVQNRNRELIYSNQFELAQAQELLQSFSLEAWLQGFGLAPPKKLVIAQTSYFESLGALITSTPMATWQAYLRFHVLSSFAPYLTASISEENFEFRGKALRGQESQAPRWKRGVRLVNSSIGEVLGRRYVDEYFSESAKQEIAQLVENLREAFRVSIDDLDWMSPETKAAAQQKLKGFLPKLGYPDTWRDFSSLELDAASLIGNVRAARKLNHEYALARLSRPVDRGEWSYPPQTVNAFYRPTHNSITFPAGILQAPMFAQGVDPAMNYGAIGSIIGHEFSHGFDDQGRKFDGEGLLRNWWSDEDAEKYKRRAEVLIAQYANFKPFEDASINGELTLGENIGDLAGVTMAYKAFELSGYADGPDIDGLSPRQRFFIGYAIAFRGKVREPYLRELLVRDNHSPYEYRVRGVLPNMPAFYEAFNVGVEDAMYMPPEQRAKIW